MVSSRTAAAFNRRRVGLNASEKVEPDLKDVRDKFSSPGQSYCY
jgi:hypothetical protein